LHVCGLDAERLGQNLCLYDKAVFADLDLRHSDPFQYPLAAASVAKCVATTWFTAMRASAFSA